MNITWWDGQNMYIQYQEQNPYKLNKNSKENKHLYIFQPYFQCFVLFAKRKHNKPCNTKWCELQQEQQHIKLFVTLKKKLTTTPMTTTI